MFISWLGKCLWSWLLCLLVLTRTWHFKLQALPTKDLVISEPVLSCIKSYLFSGKLLIISSPCLLSPFLSLIQIRNYSSTSYSCTLQWKTITFICIARSLSVCFTFFNYNDVWVLWIVLNKSFSCWLKESMLSSIWSIFHYFAWLRLI